MKIRKGLIKARSILLECPSFILFPYSFFTQWIFCCYDMFICLWIYDSIFAESRGWMKNKFLYNIGSLAVNCLSVWLQFPLFSSSQPCLLYSSILFMQIHKSSANQKVEFRIRISRNATGVIDPPLLFGETWEIRMSTQHEFKMTASDDSQTAKRLIDERV